MCRVFTHNEVLGVWCAALSELPLHLRDADARGEETTGYIDVFWIRGNRQTYYTRRLTRGSRREAHDINTTWAQPPSMREGEKLCEKRGGGKGCLCVEHHFCTPKRTSLSLNTRTGRGKCSRGPCVGVFCKRDPTSEPRLGLGEVVGEVGGNF